MGEKNKRRAKFLADHPTCCFCGDAATTEDHCPARICFRNKEGPEDWSFPACHACNSAISGTEQLVAFYIRALDFTEANIREDDLQRLARGVLNNHPDLFPKLDIPANEKRKMLAHIGVQREPGSFLADEPVMAVPTGLDTHFSFFARKLSAAIYYRATGLTLTENHLTMSRWFQSQDPLLKEVLDTLGPVWSQKMLGRRSNIDFGDQLSIIIASGSAPEVLTYVVQFGTSLCFWGGAGLPNEAQLRDTWKPYRPIKFGP